MNKQTRIFIWYGFLFSFSGIGIALNVITIIEDKFHTEWYLYAAALFQFAYASYSFYRVNETLTKN